MSFGAWVGFLIATSIPLIGLVLLIYWACSSRGKASRRNLARACLFVTALIAVVMGAVLALSPGFVSAYFRDVAAAAEAAEEASRDVEGNGSAAAGDEAGRDVGASPSAGASAPKPPTVPLDEPLRSFRSSDGRTIEARVIRLTDDTVTIRRADGREFTTDLTRFSAEDVEYFMRLRNDGGAFE